MVNIRKNNRFNRGEENKNQSATTGGGGGGVGGGGGPTRSWGTAVSGQSMSTSSSLGSPSSRSEAAAAAGDTTFLMLDNLDIQGDDDAGSQGTAGNGRKKRAQRASGGDKNSRGLRQFSMKVCEKVESKGRTTYNEVADELVAEFSSTADGPTSPDQQPHDEKNIRRRVYDALNVLMAMDIISKEKKEIQWKGLPRTTLDDIEQLQRERAGLQNCIEKKSAYLEELDDQFVGLQNLIERNKQLYGSGNDPSGGVALPFILVQTRPHATVEVEISEDMQLVHLDFNSTPFELHDDNFVLKGMKFCETPRINEGPQNISFDRGENSNMRNTYQSQIRHNPSRPGISARLPNSTPIPGILKARVKQEPQ